MQSKAARTVTESIISFDCCFFSFVLPLLRRTSLSPYRVLPIHIRSTLVEMKLGGYREYSMSGIKYIYIIGVSREHDR